MLEGKTCRASKKTNIKIESPQRLVNTAGCLDCTLGDLGHLLVGGGEVGDDLGNGNHDLERSCHISQQMPEDRRIRFDGNQYDGGKEQSEYAYEGDFLG